MRSVNVRAEVWMQRAVSIVFQGFGNHDWTEVRAADTDVDHGGDLLACVSLMLTGSQSIREGLHLLERFSDLLNARLSQTLEWIRHVRVSQSNVKDCSILRSVDVLARKHRISVLLHIGFAG